MLVTTRSFEGHSHLIIESHNDLSKSTDTKLRFLTNPASGKLVLAEQIGDRSFRHHIEVCDRALPAPLPMFKGIVQSRLIDLGLQDVDSRRFKNCCSESVEELIERRDPWGENKLLQYQGIWKDNIRTMSTQLDRSERMYADGSHWHHYAKFLEKSIERRCMLLAWLDICRKCGPKDALRYARSVNMI